MLPRLNHMGGNLIGMVLAVSPPRSDAAAFPFSSACSPEALAGTEAGPLRGGLEIHARLPGVLPQA
eukprot:7080424-Pyramimonas_sp.AAC.1